MNSYKDKIARLFLKSNIARKVLKKIFDKVNYVEKDFFESKNIEQKNDARCLVEDSILEIYPINCRKSNITTRRINLLIPALSLKYVFGGINTALLFFSELRKYFDNARIIITEEPEFKIEANPEFQDWKILSMDSEDMDGLVIMASGDRSLKTLAVSKNDIFIATAWWTACNAKRIVDWQKEIFNINTKFIYMIQDYEPGFYPWSSRYALAESTYHNLESYIAVFNSGFLYTFFKNEGYLFHDFFVFDPILNGRLKELRTLSMLKERKKQILIYGRPTVDRNCFQIIVMSLKLLIATRDINGWKFLSAGEYHEPIDLGNNNFLVSLGKMTLDEYAKILGESSIGISLMVSPHPSYPPLEMAAFGMKVITNRYKSKNLSVMSDNIFSLEFISPDNLETMLFDLIKDVENSNIFDVDLTKNNAMFKYINRDNIFEDIATSINKLLE